MIWAMGHKVECDAFVIYTDNETWCGGQHPAQALAQYRRHHNPEARLVVVGMTATRFSIADPADPGMLDVVGFDTAAPALISGFVGGKI
jgi:60 kDa SS-A/Ro ribonucleoprotein